MKMQFFQFGNGPGSLPFHAFKFIRASNGFSSPGLTVFSLHVDWQLSSLQEAFVDTCCCFLQGQNRRLVHLTSDC
uniref:Uncharacterized protein n=1 Tax=Rhizophora mucronata TaxID=61149 RepID=A0A2P2JIH6_RHIMU